VNGTTPSQHLAVCVPVWTKRKDGYRAAPPRRQQGGPHRLAGACLHGVNLSLPIVEVCPLAGHYGVPVTPIRLDWDHDRTGLATDNELIGSRFCSTGFSRDRERTSATRQNQRLMHEASAAVLVIPAKTKTSRVKRRRMLLVITSRSLPAAQVNSRDSGVIASPAPRAPNHALAQTIFTAEPPLRLPGNPSKIDCRNPVRHHTAECLHFPGSCTTVEHAPYGQIPKHALFAGTMTRRLYEVETPKSEWQRPGLLLALADDER
jgi:hypothetical protein